MEEGGGGSASEEMCCYHAELSGLWQSISHEVKLSPSFLSLSRVMRHSPFCVWTHDGTQFRLQIGVI